MVAVMAPAELPGTVTFVRDLLQQIERLPKIRIVCGTGDVRE